MRIQKSSGHITTPLLAGSLACRVAFSALVKGVAAAAFICVLVPRPAEGQDVRVGTNIPPMSRGPGITRSPAPSAQSTTEEPGLAAAMVSLNAEAASRGELPAVWNTVATHAQLPAKALRQQRAQTRLNVSELLVANSLAGKSGRSFGTIIALRAAAGSWTQVARNLRINLAPIKARLIAANTSLKKAKVGRPSKRPA